MLYICAWYGACLVQQEKCISGGPALALLCFAVPSYRPTYPAMRLMGREMISKAATEAVTAGWKDGGAVGDSGHNC